MDASLVIGACTALGSAIGFLFRVVMKQSREHAATARTYSDQHSDLRERVGRLEGEKKGIEELSKKTLEVVHSAIAQTDTNGT